MQFVIGFVLGLAIMFIALFPPLKAAFSRRRPIGDLRVDRSDPSDAPYLFLELDQGTDVNTIIRSKYAVFRVKLKDFLPHD